MRLKMASRKSDLARIQLHTVGEYLKKKLNIEPEYIYRESFGDKNLDVDLSGAKNKGLFTQDFYESLINEDVDMVVHSWKDLPIEDKETTIALTLEREDVRDVLLVKKNRLTSIKENSRINILTSSPRREFFLSHHLNKLYPTELKAINFTPIRGNVPTRLQKLIDSSADALVIAKAALDRMLSAEGDEFNTMKSSMKKNLEACQWMVLPVSYFPSAAAQGALAVEVLKTSPLREKLKQINFLENFESVKKERATLKKYGGGCHSKLGVNFLQRSYGEFYCFSHEVDGKIVTDLKLITENKILKTTLDKIWPENGKIPADRLPLEVHLAEFTQAEALWISKMSAVPKNFTPSPGQFVWTSGLISWQKLADKGVWVHGTNESLGEKEPMRIDILAGKKLNWCKLSHKHGAKTDKKLIPTYVVKWNFKKEHFVGKEHFYWMSGEMFKQAVQVCPEIKFKQHYCGPGHSYDEISKHVENLTVCLGYKEWKKEIIDEL